MRSMFEFCVICLAIAAVSCNSIPRHTEGTELYRTAGDDLPTASQVMAGVARRYGPLTYFRAGGVNSHRSTFDGELTENSEVAFEIMYDRKANSASIKWTEDEPKLFRIEGTKSWLDEGGIRRNFETPKDGLGTITISNRGWTLFLIEIFVFRDEIGLGDTFFNNYLNPTVTGKEVIDGEWCYVFRGTFAGVEADITYWIDEEDFLIRKIEKQVVIRKVVDEKEWVRRAVTTETYSNIELR